MNDSDFKYGREIIAAVEAGKYLFQAVDLRCAEIVALPNPESLSMAEAEERERHITALIDKGFVVGGKTKDGNYWHLSSVTDYGRRFFGI